jgi:hypothetical protein
MCSVDKHAFVRGASKQGTACGDRLFRRVQVESGVPIRSVDLNRVEYRVTSPQQLCSVRGHQNCYVAWRVAQSGERLHAWRYDGVPSNQVELALNRWQVALCQGDERYLALVRKGQA